MSEEHEELEIVHRLSKVMRRKLAENRHKDHWLTYDPFDVLDNLLREVGELEVEMSSGDLNSIEEECADIANFAAMIAAVFRHRAKLDEL